MSHSHTSKSTRPVPRNLALAAGSLAMATVPAHAAIVQITLTGNMISTTGGNQLNADFTGDNTPDVTFKDLDIDTSYIYVSFANTGLPGNSSPAIIAASYSSSNSTSSFYARAFDKNSADSQPNSITGQVTIRFTDARINGGASTAAYIEGHAFNTSSTDHTAEFTRLIFDDASTSLPSGVAPADPAYPEWSAVLEPGGLSGIALLSLGAGGLLARRRRAAA